MALRCYRVKSMKTPDLTVVVVFGALDPEVHLPQVILGGLALLALLIYCGIALPAVWSAKPARRKAAANVLCQILDVLRRQ
jgi:hypothetical protein